jgi:reactive intermediate/imine deaminase
MKQPVHSDHAPAAIGPYSQAIKHGDTMYLSGQIPLDPSTMQLVEGDIDTQINRVFDNLQAVCKAAECSLDNILKLHVFLTDLTNFPRVNEIMSARFSEPFPARAAIGVAALPMGAEVEMDAIVALD